MKLYTVKPEHLPTSADIYPDLKELPPFPEGYWEPEPVLKVPLFGERFLSTANFKWGTCASDSDPFLDDLFRLCLIPRKRKRIVFTEDPEGDWACLELTRNWGDHNGFHKFKHGLNGCLDNPPCTRYTPTEEEF